MNWQLTLHANTSELPELKNRLERLLVQEWHISGTDACDIVLSVDEALTNVIMHGYDEADARNNDLIYLDLELASQNSTQKVIVRVSDHGKQFDIHSVPRPNLQENLSGRRIGGFGVFMMKTLMDTVNVYRNNDKNLLCMEKVIR